MVAVEWRHNLQRRRDDGECCGDVVDGFLLSFQRRLQCFVVAPLEEEQGLTAD